MDARTFMRSLFALRGYFVRIAALGAEGAPFEELERCGIDAEARMFAATGGINTHRGAIFMLGLLCAAAGATAAGGIRLTPKWIRQALVTRWGESLKARALRPAILPGAIASRRHGLRGASDEAALGFPNVFDVAIPALQGAYARGLPHRESRLESLFHIIAILEDSNLAHRGGLQGLGFAQCAARSFLERGGVAEPNWVDAAETIGREFVRRNLSPGGAADSLAAACLLHRLSTLSFPV